MVKGRAQNAELGQGAAHRQRRLLDQPDDFQLPGGGVSHAPSSPAAIVIFLSSRFSSTSSATTSLYYRWSKEFLEAGKKRLAGDSARARTSD
jgi:hypothetical protein